MENLIFFSLLASVVIACRDRPMANCNDSSIQGVFLLIDGTGTFASQWAKVLPFVRYFENILDNRMPVWLVQFSIEPDRCHLGQAWGCVPGAHCGTPTAHPNCPDTNEVHLEPGWTKEDFQNASGRVFRKWQNGWTFTWHFIRKASEEWSDYKKSHNMGADARALMVFMSDGQAYNDGQEPAAVKAFKEANMKFVGVYEQSHDSTFDKYVQLLDDPTDDTYVKSPRVGDQFSEDFAKLVFQSGCEVKKKH